MAEIDLLAMPAVLDQGDAMVAPAPLRSMASLALYGDDLKPLLDVLGGTLPLPGRQRLDGGILYLWSGPASWLALAEDDDLAFCAGLASRLAGIAAVTDQSDGRVVLRVQGPAVREALAKLVPIDLHPRVFQDDATALTVAGHVGVQIWRSGENSFDLACFRSFADSLYQALRQACRAFQMNGPG